jgi:hypothetical protein
MNLKVTLAILLLLFSIAVQSPIARTHYQSLDETPLILNSYRVFFEDFYNYDNLSTGTDGLWDAIVVEMNFSIDILAILSLDGVVWSTGDHDFWYEDGSLPHDGIQINSLGIHIISIYFSPGNLFTMGDSIDLEFEINYGLYDVDDEGNWIDYAYDNIGFAHTVDGTEFAPPIFDITSDLEYDFIDSDSNELFDQIKITFQLMVYTDVSIHFWLDFFNQNNEDPMQLIFTGKIIDFYAGLHNLSLTIDSVFLGQFDITDNIFLELAGESVYYNNRMDIYNNLDVIPLDANTNEFDFPPVYFVFGSKIAEGRYNDQDQTTFDYLYVSIDLIVDKKAWVEIQIDLYIPDDYWFSEYYSEEYNVGNYTLKLIVEGNELYNLNAEGDAWIYYFGIAYSDSFDYFLPTQEYKFNFNNADFNPESVYDPSDDDTSTDETTNANNGTNAPGLDIIPAPSVYLSLLGLVAIVVIRKKR